MVYDCVMTFVIYTISPYTICNLNYNHCKIKFLSLSSSTSMYCYHPTVYHLNDLCIIIMYYSFSFSHDNL